MLRQSLLIKVVYDTDYIEMLNENGKRGKRKAMAYMLYAYNIELGLYYSSRYYAVIWGIGKTTVCNWIKHFNTVIDNTDNYISSVHKGN